MTFRKLLHFDLWPLNALKTNLDQMKEMEANLTPDATAVSDADNVTLDKDVKVLAESYLLYKIGEKAVLAKR